MKVTEDMIKGDITGFPVEVVQRMVECQVEQGSKAGVSVFADDRYCDNALGGFDWEDTSEHKTFWFEVIHNRNFDLFFERYHKQNPSIKHRFKIPDGCSVTVEDDFIVIEKH